MEFEVVVLFFFFYFINSRGRQRERKWADDLTSLSIKILFDNLEIILISLHG
jgi:hypothetical protein